MCAKVTKGNQCTWLLSIAHTWIDAYFTSSQSSEEVSSYHCKNSLKVLQKLEKKTRKHPTVDENQHHKREVLISISSVQFSSVAQSCMIFCDPMNCCMTGLPVHHQLPELTQTHVHPVEDAIQPSHPLPSTSPPAPNHSQHQGLFQWVKSSHEVAKVLKFQLQHQPLQWKTRTDLR